MLSLVTVAKFIYCKASVGLFCPLSLRPRDSKLIVNAWHVQCALLGPPFPKLPLVNSECNLLSTHSRTLFAISPPSTARRLLSTAHRPSPRLSRSPHATHHLCRPLHASRRPRTQQYPLQTASSAYIHTYIHTYREAQCCVRRSLASPALPRPSRLDGSLLAERVVGDIHLLYPWCRISQSALLARSAGGSSAATGLTTHRGRPSDTRHCTCFVRIEAAGRRLVHGHAFLSGEAARVYCVEAQWQYESWS